MGGGIGIYIIICIISINLHMFALSDVRHTAIHAIVFEILILKKLIKKRRILGVERERHIFYSQ